MAMKTCNGFLCFFLALSSGTALRIKQGQDDLPTELSRLGAMLVNHAAPKRERSMGQAVTASSSSEAAEKRSAQAVPQGCYTSGESDVMWSNYKGGEMFTGEIRANPAIAGYPPGKKNCKVDEAYGCIFHQIRQAYLTFQVWVPWLPTFTYRWVFNGMASGWINLFGLGKKYNNFGKLPFLPGGSIPAFDDKTYDYGSKCEYGGPTHVCRWESPFIYYLPTCTECPASSGLKELGFETCTPLSYDKCKTFPGSGADWSSFKNNGTGAGMPPPMEALAVFKGSTPRKSVRPAGCYYYNGPSGNNGVWYNSRLTSFGNSLHYTWEGLMPLGCQNFDFDANEPKKGNSVSGFSPNKVVAVVGSSVSEGWKTYSDNWQSCNASSWAQKFATKLEAYTTAVDFVTKVGANSDRIFKNCQSYLAANKPAGVLGAKGRDLKSVVVFAGLNNDGLSKTLTVDHATKLATRFTGRVLRMVKEIKEHSSAIPVVVGVYPGKDFKKFQVKVLYDANERLKAGCSAANKCVFVDILGKLAKACDASVIADIPNWTNSWYFGDTECNPGDWTASYTSDAGKHPSADGAQVIYDALMDSTGIRSALPMITDASAFGSGGTAFP